MSTPGIIFHSLQNHFYLKIRTAPTATTSTGTRTLKKNLSCSLAFPLLRITTPEDKKTKRKKTPSSISNHDKIPNKINQAIKQASNHSLTHSINQSNNQSS
jgi:hypothetical protein